MPLGPWRGPTSRRARGPGSSRVGKAPEALGSATGVRGEAGAQAPAARGPRAPGKVSGRAGGRRHASHFLNKVPWTQGCPETIEGLEEPWAEATWRGKGRDGVNSSLLLRPNLSGRQSPAEGRGEPWTGSCWAGYLQKPMTPLSLAASRRTPCAVNITGKGLRKRAGGEGRRRDSRVTARLGPMEGPKTSGRSRGPRPTSGQRQSRRAGESLELARPRPDLLGPPPGVSEVPGHSAQTLSQRPTPYLPRGHGSLDCRSPRTQ